MPIYTPHECQIPENRQEVWDDAARELSVSAKAYTGYQIGNYRHEDALIAQWRFHALQIDTSEGNESGHRKLTATVTRTDTYITGYATLSELRHIKPQGAELAFTAELLKADPLTNRYKHRLMPATLLGVPRPHTPWIFPQVELTKRVEQLLPQHLGAISVYEETRVNGELTRQLHRVQGADNPQLPAALAELSYFDQPQQFAGLARALANLREGHTLPSAGPAYDLNGSALAEGPEVVPCPLWEDALLSAGYPAAKIA